MAEEKTRAEELLIRKRELKRQRLTGMVQAVVTNVDHHSLNNFYASIVDTAEKILKEIDRRIDDV